MKFSLSTAFLLLSYFCLIAAVAGDFWRTSLMVMPGDEIKTHEAVLGTLFGVGVIAISVLVGGLAVCRLGAACASLRWKKTIGTILPSQMLGQQKQHEKTWGKRERNMIRICYEFQVDGVICTGASWSSREFEVGQPVTVYFNPARPADNCLAIGRDLLNLLVTVAFNLAFGAIGAAVLARIVVYMFATS